MLVGLLETPEACANAAAMAKEGVDAFFDRSGGPVDEDGISICTWTSKCD